VSEFDPPALAVRGVVAAALAEDLGVAGDITSLACIPADAMGEAHFVARAPGVLAGTAGAIETFRQVDPSVRTAFLVHDGGRVAAGEEIGRLEGPMRSLLTGERTALNFLTHCSGIATLTRRFVDAVERAGGRARVRDTRKTLPGLRAIEKAAVRAGGGANHRDSLSDAVLVKDNHVAVSGIAAAVRAARDRWPGRVLEIECDSLAEVDEAIASGATLVLLDNMSPEQVGDAVERVGGRVELEVSGGVDLDNVGAYAATGVDYIAIGAITHSAPALDIALDVEHPAAGPGGGALQG
jgi:nicotinate-nucleotide pyrophosphorylase (carboxylating)